MKTYAQLRTDVLDKAAKDEGFRARLLADPKAAVQEATGLALPDSVTIEVHEESVGVGHLVLPVSGSLADEDLEQIAAGDIRRNQYGDRLRHHHPGGDRHGDEYHY